MGVAPNDTRAPERFEYLAGPPLVASVLHDFQHDGLCILLTEGDERGGCVENLRDDDAPLACDRSDRHGHIYAWLSLLGANSPLRIEPGRRARTLQTIDVEGCAQEGRKLVDLL